MEVLHVDGGKELHPGDFLPFLQPSADLPVDRPFLDLVPHREEVQLLFLEEHVEGERVVGGDRPVRAFLEAADFEDAVRNAVNELSGKTPEAAPGPATAPAFSTRRAFKKNTQYFRKFSQYFRKNCPYFRKNCQYFCKNCPYFRFSPDFFPKTGGTFRSAGIPPP